MSKLFLHVGTILLCCIALSGTGLAQVDQARPDFQIALLRYTGGTWNPRPHGLPRLAWEIRRRTSIAMDLETAAVDPADEAIFNYPLLVMQGDRSFPSLPQRGITLLRRHLTMGGTLFVDISDGVENGPFHRSVQREIQRIFPDLPLTRIAAEHVIYKSFYLVDRHGGRLATRSYLEGISLGDRLALVVYANDLAGATARDEFGEWEYDVGAGGHATREATFRLGVNVVMYVLCLDYKEDQVHIPFILQRRR